MFSPNQHPTAGRVVRKWLWGCAWRQSFLLVTDNRRSRLDSPFCVITQHRKFVFGHHRQSKKDMQCSGTDNEAITDFNFCYSTNQFQTAQLQITQKKNLAPALSSFFQFLHSLMINFLYIVLMWEGFSALFFCLWQLLLLKKDFEGLIYVFPL